MVLCNGCPLIAKACDWSFDYLADKMSPDFQCDVYVSKSKRFMYWDAKKNQSGYDFTPPTRKVTMPFQEFREHCAKGTKEADGEHYYLQVACVFGDAWPFLLPSVTPP